MTPQELHDYKLGWKIAQNFYRVRLHSDLYRKGIDWCKKNLHLSSWDITVWTDSYEHTFLFEYKHNADEFKKEWPEFTDQ